MDRKYFIITGIILFLLIVGVSNLLGASARAGEEENEVESGVEWVYDFEEGLSRAREEKKTIMIDFYTEWCVYCEWLDRDTYGNEEVASFLNENLVSIKIDAEKDITLAENHRISAFPTIVFLSSSGTEMGRIRGYKPPDQFLQQVTEIVNSQG